MKPLFLDIDGVLNSVTSFHNRHHVGKDIDQQICPSNVEILNVIIELTGAQLVVSSVWRLSRSIADLQKLLDYGGVKGQVIGKTNSISPTVQRGLEIAQWIREHAREIESFVILDDDSDMGHLHDRFVKTDVWFGLHVENIVPAVRCLTRPYTKEENTILHEVLAWCEL